jgi:hypothetical protein
VLVAPRGGELQPHVAAEARGKAFFGVGQILALARRLALAAVKDVNELEDKRAAAGDQHRPLERRRVIAPENCRFDDGAPVGKAHRFRGRALDLHERRAERAHQIAQAARELVAHGVEQRKGIAALRPAEQQRRLRVGLLSRRGVCGRYGFGV